MAHPYVETELMEEVKLALLAAQAKAKTKPLPHRDEPISPAESEDQWSAQWAQMLEDDRKSMGK